MIDVIGSAQGFAAAWEPWEGRAGGVESPQGRMRAGALAAGLALSAIERH